MKKYIKYVAKIIIILLLVTVIGGCNSNDSGDGIDFSDFLKNDVSDEDSNGSIFNSFFKSNYEKVVSDYFKALENKDADLMYSSVTAKYWIDSFNKGFGDSAYETIQEDIDDFVDSCGCGDNIKIKYEIKGETKASTEELQELEDVIYDWYACYAFESRSDFSITEAYLLDIEFTVIGEQDTVASYNYPGGFLVIKENGEWRVPRGHISCSFYSN